MGSLINETIITICFQSHDQCRCEIGTDRICTCMTAAASKVWRQRVPRPQRLVVPRTSWVSLEMSILISFTQLALQARTSIMMPEGRSTRHALLRDARQSLAQPDFGAEKTRIDL